MRNLDLETFNAHIIAVVETSLKKNKFQKCSLANYFKLKTKLIRTVVNLVE